MVIVFVLFFVLVIPFYVQGVLVFKDLDYTGVL